VRNSSLRARCTRPFWVRAAGKSRTANRIVLQAYPPFLVVHTNAAYGRWTGLDSHLLVGQPIANLVSLPEPPASRSTVEANGASRLDGVVVVGALPSRHDQGHHQAMLLDRLIVASGFGRVHEVRVRTSRLPATLPCSGKNAMVRDQCPNQETLLHSESGSSVEFVACRIAMAPIVSTDLNVASNGTTASLWDQAAAAAAADDANSRYDYSPQQISARTMASTRSNRRQKCWPRVTHFVLQLQSDRAGAQDNDLVQSANAASANHSHKSKSCSTTASDRPHAVAVHHHPPGAVPADNGPDNAVEMDASVSSEPDAVAAIG
jgi:hypothetical protein